MDRRSFLRWAAASGVVLSVESASEEARADDQPYGGPFWVFVNAAGGWDPIYLCDPKTDAALNRLYAGPARAGAISYAPTKLDAAALGLDATYADEYLASWLRSNDAFFRKYGSRLTVLNGVDTATNNHDVGTRVTWSGRASEGYPALGALVAAARGVDKPLGFLSSGGYDATGGVIAVTRLDNAGVLQKLAYPGRIDPAKADGDRYHSDATLARIVSAQSDRLAALSAAQGLPRLRQSMSSLALARNSKTGLDRLEVPTNLVTIPGYQMGDLQGMLRQVQLTLAAFRAGIAVSATVNLGGFDTHANHDRDQIRQIAKLLRGIDYLWDEAQALGLADKMVMVVGSDFGRGPGYNGTNGSAGKDHWPVTSMLVMGAGIPGDRVVGATDDGSKARNIDPASLAPSDGGVRLTPELVHLALRKVAGVDGAEAAKGFPFASQPVPLFG